MANKFKPTLTGLLTTRLTKALTVAASAGAAVAQFFKQFFTDDVSPFTFTRAGEQTVEDFEGVLRTVPTDVPAIRGGRFEQPLITGSQHRMNPVGGASDVHNGGLEYTITRNGVTANVATRGFYLGNSIAGREFAPSVEVRAATAADVGKWVQLRLKRYAGAIYIQSTTYMQLTADYVTHTLPTPFIGSENSTGMAIEFHGNVGGNTVADSWTYRNLQCWDVTGRANKAPPEFAEGARWYNTTNPNRVVNNVVVSDVPVVELPARSATNIAPLGLDEAPWDIRGSAAITPVAGGHELTGLTASESNAAVLLNVTDDMSGRVFGFSFTFSAADPADVGKTIQVRVKRNTGPGSGTNFSAPLTAAPTRYFVRYEFATGDTGYRVALLAGTANQCIVESSLMLEEDVDVPSEPGAGLRWYGTTNPNRVVDNVVVSDVAPVRLPARRVENLVDTYGGSPQDLTVGWTKKSGATTSPGAVSFGPFEYSRIALPTGGSVSGVGYVIAFTASAPGGGTVRVRAGGVKSPDISISDTPRRYAARVVGGIADNDVAITNGLDGVVRTVQITDVSVEIIDGGAPSNFVADYGYSAYEQDTVVDANNVVTDAPSGRVAEVRGIQLEGAGTNYLTQSENFADPAWFKISSATVDSDGKTISLPNSTSGIEDYASAGAPLTGRAFTVTIRAKGNGTVQLRLRDNLNTEGLSLTLDLTSELETYTLTHEFTSSTETQVGMWLRRQPGADTATEVFVDFVQLEEGEFSSSYIPTDGAAASRSPTSLTQVWEMPPNDFSGHFKIRPMFSAGDAPFVAAMGIDAGSANRMSVVLTSSGVNLLKAVDGAIAAAAETGVPYSAYDLLNIRFRFDADGIHLWINDEGKVSSTTTAARADFTTLPSNMEIGTTLGGAQQAFQVVESIQIWNEAKSDAFLEALT